LNVDIILYCFSDFNRVHVMIGACPFCKGYTQIVLLNTLCLIVCQDEVVKLYHHIIYGGLNISDITHPILGSNVYYCYGTNVPLPT